MFWHSDHMSGWGWALMSFGMIGFWALLIISAGFLVRSWRKGSPSPGGPSAPPTPERVLAERFAHGEIDEPEYGHRLASLHRPLR